MSIASSALPRTRKSKRNGAAKRNAASRRLMPHEPTAIATDDETFTGDVGLFPESVDIRPPDVRPLKAYAFDPSQGRYLGNEMTLKVKYERLRPGPIGRRIAVIDYDGANQTFYKPVDLDNPNLLMRGGLDPSESDPRFHQQMVYAVITETIQHFEAALGRRIHWRRAERGPDGKPIGGDADIYTLNIFPHAMVSANAFYSPKAHGILF